MTSRALPLTYGIEEEFFLVDPRSRDLVAAVPKQFAGACRYRFGDRVQEEMHRSQVETATPVLHTADMAREALTELRSGVHRIAYNMGMMLVAAGTHPLAAWGDHSHTAKPRYDRLIDDFQMVGRRNLLCGLHVHVGVPESIDRIELMNRLMPWVPLFLAFSTSSPFWNQRRTGLLSYRQAAYDEWPRTGIPDALKDESEYSAFVALLTRCEALLDGSFLWWVIRPSARYPTLELRIADACTHIEDSLALAATFRCLVRAHIRCPALGQARTPLTRRLIDENRWRAKRYGTQSLFIDEPSASQVTMGDMLRQLFELVAPDAEALGCEGEVHHLASILNRGSSAHAQLALYRHHRGRDASRQEALIQVVDWLADTTAAEERSERRWPVFTAAHSESGTVKA